MFILGIVVGTIATIGTSFILYYKQKSEFHVFANNIETIIREEPLKEGIQNAKTMCRETVGLPSAGVYCALDAVEKKLKNG